ncbi:MAG: adenylate kinase [Candidatus Brocadiia bacterium]
MAFSVVLLGPPGSGKGTQAKTLESDYAMLHLSTGDMLRSAVAAGSDLGLKAKKFMNDGALVPDDLIIAMLLERLKAPDCSRGFMLDGFPRTIPQAEALDAALKQSAGRIDFVLYFNSEPEKIIARMSGRRTCQKCGAVYHVKNNPPKVEGICGFCGDKLIQRPDDNEMTLRKRLTAYFAQTAPLIDYYRTRGVLHEIEADRPIPEITADLAKVFSKVLKRQ